MNEEDIKKLVRQIVIEEMSELRGLNKYTFQHPIEVFDGRNIRFGRINGTKIGTSDAEKIGFYGVTPVNKPETIADPTGGAVEDAQARGAIAEIIDRLQELGLLK